MREARLWSCLMISITCCCVASAGICIVPLTFPLNCTAIFTVSSTRSFSSKVGRVAWVNIENLFPRVLHRISSARCGANGAIRMLSVCNVFLLIIFASLSALTRIMSWDMAVLNLKFSISSVTFLMVLWSNTSC